MWVYFWALYSVPLIGMPAFACHTIFYSFDFFPKKKCKFLACGPYKTRQQALRGLTEFEESLPRWRGRKEGQSLASGTAASRDTTSPKNPLLPLVSASLLCHVANMITDGFWALCLPAVAMEAGWVDPMSQIYASWGREALVLLSQEWFESRHLRLVGRWGRNVVDPIGLLLEN